jgi:hypothetical protein
MKLPHKAANSSKIVAFSSPVGIFDEQEGLASTTGGTEASASTANSTTRTNCICETLNFVEFGQFSSVHPAFAASYYA